MKLPWGEGCILTTILTTLLAPFPLKLLIQLQPAEPCPGGGSELGLLQLTGRTATRNPRVAKTVLSRKGQESSQYHHWGEYLVRSFYNLKSAHKTQRSFRKEE